MTVDLDSLTAKGMQIVDDAQNPTKKYYPHTLAKYVKNNAGQNLGGVPADAEKNAIVKIKMNNSELTIDANRTVDLGTVITSHQSISEKADKATTLAGYGITDAYTKTQIDGKIASAYKAAGSAANIAGLGSLDASHEGFVYNMSAEFTTTADFIEGAGKKHPAGTNVVIVNSASSGNAVYKYDVLAGFVDLSDYAKSSSLPTKLSDLTDDLLTDYSKASSASAVSASDSVKAAIGKIEKALDGKQASGSYAASDHSHSNYVPTTRKVNNKALSADISLTASDVGAAASSHSHVGTEMTLTGYSKASSASAVAATDTVNAAIGKLEKALDGKQASGSYANATHSHVGTEVTLTGYAKAGSVSAVAATDTVNAAIGKLEKAIESKLAFIEIDD